MLIEVKWQQFVFDKAFVQEFKCFLKTLHLRKSMEIDLNDFVHRFKKYEQKMFLFL